MELVILFLVIVLGGLLVVWAVEQRERLDYAAYQQRRAEAKRLMDQRVKYYEIDQLMWLQPDEDELEERVTYQPRWGICDNCGEPQDGSAPRDYCARCGAML